MRNDIDIDIELDIEELEAKTAPSGWATLD